jgi:hypothetical protein
VKPRYSVSRLSTVPLIERFLTKVEKTGVCAIPGLAGGGCWLWMGGRRNKEGHGGFAVSHDRVVPAYRFAYEHYRGSIADGLVPDHLCRTPQCVNPWHLELVTPRVNTLRGRAPSAMNAQKTHCVRGHQFTPENTRISSGRRICRACHAEKLRRFREEHPDKMVTYKETFRARRAARV